mgnify:CR=1 FL=1|nr:MAG TPA: hypothetical protein [Caudoviricetes sp.]
MEDYGIVNNAILEQAGYFEKHIDKNVVVDTDAHFIIDAITRKIKNTGDKKELVQGDHNSERFTFECPRYIEGHDMTLVNKIIVNYMNVSTSGAYEVDDLTSDDEKITFSWLISKNATENVGKLVFAISFKCVQEDEKITYEWHTTINDDIRIIDGLNNETSIVEDNVDILEQWKRELFGASDGEVSKIQEASNQAQIEIEDLTTSSKNDIETLATNSKTEINSLTETKKTELNKINNDITNNASSLKEAIVNAADAKKGEINQKGLEVLQSIPEDMGKIQDTTLIKSTESGTEINLTDSSDMNIQELHLFGKSEQKTTKGIQLLDLSSMKSGTGDGLTYTNRGDGSVQVSGTATSQTGNIWFRGRYDTNSEKLPTLLTLEAGKKYYIKDCILFEVATNINTQTEVIEVSAEEYPEGRRITGIRNPKQVVGKTYNEVIYPLIAESSTAVDWEEYTGEQPSPNPDYPQGMNCVKNPVIKIAGKNLFDCSNKEFSTKCYINERANILGRALQNNSELGYCFPAAQGKYNISASTNFRTAFSREKLDENANGTINVSGVATTKAKATIEAKEDGYIYVCNSTDFYKNEKKLMISKMEANEYEEYKEIQTVQPTCELNGIDDVRDELIVRADGTGQLIQKWKKRTIDDSVSFYIDLNPKHEVGVLINLLAYKDATNAQSSLYSLIYSDELMAVKNIYDEDVVGIGYTLSSNYVRLRLPVSIGTTNEEIKNYLEQNPIEILYLLKEPIVNELSAEEVQKILNLHTNKTNTTIWNDQNAEMQVTYVADTKSYVDKKFKELSDAIVASASEAE